MPSKNKSLRNAIRREDDAKVKQLLEQQVDIFHPDRNGVNALHLAAAGVSKERYRILSRLILARKDDVTCVANEGTTPLLIASLYNNHAGVRLLLAAGAIDIPNSDGDTAESIARVKNDSNVIKVFEEKKQKEQDKPKYMRI